MSSINLIRRPAACPRDPENIRVAEMEAAAVIPPKWRKKHRTYDKHYYKDRNLIERFFCKLKQFSGIATRYCKRGKYFLEAVKLASSIILMR